MKTLRLSMVAVAAGLLIAAPAFAETGPDATTSAAPSTQKQRTDGDGPPMVGPASAAFKQRTDGESAPMVGPASAAFKQRTDGESPTMVGPGSGAFKQN